MRPSHHRYASASRLSVLSRAATSNVFQYNPSDFLYGDKNGQSLAGTFDDLQRYDVLLDWSAEQWIELLLQ